MSEGTVKTFEVGGKGKKQCPECEKYVGAVTKICACNFSFIGFKRPNVIENEIKEIKTFNEGGKGKKQCPECKIYLGAVSKKCICGYVFVKKTKPIIQTKVVQEKIQEKVQEDNKPETRRNLSYMLGCRTNLSTPAGPCPHKLEGTEPEVIDAWIEKVRADFRKNSKSLAPSALVYFVRQFYEMFSDDYMLVKNYIEESLKDEICC